tara:strand:- start:430 stop:2868 length:2439 start_codon:yes stop_codon:yes gene_type:complete
LLNVNFVAHAYGESTIILDITNPATSCTVKAAFKINVIGDPNAPTDIVLGGTQIAENTVGDFTLLAVDNDSEGHTFQLLPASGYPDNQHFSIVSGKLTFSNFNYESPLDADGDNSYSLGIRTSDNQLDTAGANLTFDKVVVVTVTDANDLPVVQDVTEEVPSGSVATITVQGVDEDSDPLTFTIKSTPSAGTVSVQGSTITYTPTSTNLSQDIFQYAANDGISDSETKTITLNFIAPLVSAPIVTTANGTIVTGTAEAGSTVTVYASDGTTVLGTAIADGSGNYTVTMSPAQSDGASISVTATDTSGNVSSPTSTSIGFDSIVSIWNGDVSGDWSDIGNWSNGVPSTNYYVEIPTGLSNYPTASSAVVVNTMTLASGSSFIAQSTFTGAVTYNRTLSSNNWYLVSSPVVGETLEGLISNHTFATGSGSNIGIAPYANDGSAWDYQTTEASGSLASGSGYSVKLAAAGAVSFNGTFPDADVSIGITEDANGLNLVGNPYPSYLAANSNADAVNNILSINSTTLSEETLWFWNSGSSSYVTYNQASSSKFVSPAQGFFVNSNGANSFQFTEAMQSHQSDSFQRSTATRPEINLMLSNDTDTRSTDIFFIEGTTTGWDNGYDSSIFGGTANSFAIYTHLVSDSEGQNLAIQSLPETNFENWIIPVGINAVAGAAITIVAASQNLPEGIDVYLEDKVAGSFTRLATGESYTTTLSEALNGIGRYYLHTSAQVLRTDDLMHANISIYTISENSIRIVGVQSGSVKVRVYSVLGKQMHATSFQGNGMNDVDLPKVAKGVYLIQLETEIGVLNKKVIIE